MRSSLAPHLLRDPTPTEQLRELAAEAWRQSGGKVAVIWPEDLHNEADRQSVFNAATRLYGRRNGKTCDGRI